MKPTQLYPTDMNITSDIVRDSAQLRCIGSLMSRCTPNHIVLSHNISDIPFPIHTKYLTLSYNVNTIDDLLQLRKELTRIRAHTIIIHNSSNLIRYLRENTFVIGCGLFGAMLRNEYIHKLIIQCNPFISASKSERKKEHDLKKDLKKEQQEYREPIINPLQKVKIRVQYD